MEVSRPNKAGSSSCPGWAARDMKLSSSMDEIQAFHDAVFPRANGIGAYCNGFGATYLEMFIEPAV